jgi:hypothetical protein
MLKNESMKLTGWRLGGVIAFALFALMELGDWAGLIPGYSNPSQYADRIGLSAQAESTHLIILTMLALLVVIAALATVVGLVARATWSMLAARATGGAFVLYGIYQVISALMQLTKNQMGVSIAGVIYALIGGLAVWVGTRAVKQSDLPTHSLSSHRNMRQMVSGMPSVECKRVLEGHRTVCGVVKRAFPVFGSN